MQSRVNVITSVLDEVAKNVSTEIYASDHMFPKTGKLEDYLAVGRSALSNILAAAQCADTSEVRKFLDFGCGAGRVLRWLSAAFPEAEAYVCDLNQDWTAFCANTFGARVVPSHVNLEALDIGSNYDLIWAGSLLTHLSETNALRALDVMHEALAPNGIMVFSAHGRRVLYNRLSGRAQYIVDRGFHEILLSTFLSGYGFASHESKGVGGISLTRPEWFFAWCGKRIDRRLVHFSEAAWAEHQDVIAVARTRVHGPIH